jgi:hypothetical protein
MVEVKRNKEHLVGPCERAGFEEGKTVQAEQGAITGRANQSRRWQHGRA